MILACLGINNFALSKQFSTIDHLASAYDIYQDNNGYIWISGQHGLIRFDGENHINFAAGNELWPLPFTWSHSIAPFKKQLLISTQVHGIFIFNPETGTTRKVNIPDTLDAIEHATEFNNKIYFKANSYLYSLNLVTNQVTLLNDSDRITDIVRTRANIYFITHNKVSMLNENEELEEVFSEKVNAHTLVSDKLIIASQKNIYIYNKDNLVTTKPTKEKIRNLIAHNDGKKILAVEETGVIVQYNVEDLSREVTGFPQVEKKTLFKLLHDNSGVLWITSNTGVERLIESQIQNTPKLFDVFYNHNKIAFINDELTVATYGDGLHTMDGKSKYLHPSVNDSFINRAKILTAIQQKRTQLILGTFNGVWSYTLNSKQAEKLPFEANDNIVLRLVDTNEKLYIGTNSAGLKIYSWAAKQIIETVDHKNGLKNLEVIDILPLSNGDIWLATSNNIEIYNTSTQKVRQTHINIPNKVISLQKFNDKIYAFTKGSGILTFNLQGELLSHFAQGLDFGYSKLVNDEFWIPAKPGLYRFNPLTEQLTLVTGTEAFSVNSEVILHKNKIYAWHTQGLLSVEYNNNEVFNANIEVSKATISGKSYLNQSQFQLNSSNDVVILDLASLDHRPSNKKQYQYRINDSVWTNSSGNQITLTGLKSGDYTIEIKGTNSVGQWSNDRALAQISVAYPWYWTLKVRILYSVTLTCLILFGLWFFYLRANSMTKVHQLLENELTNKGKKALSIHRSLSLAMQLIEQENIIGAKDIIRQSIETLDETKSQSEPNNLYGNTLSVALPYLAEYLHRKYHITLTNKLDIDESKLDYELQANIYKIVYESITSAILNSESRVFNIHIQDYRSKLWLTISDDENSFAHFNSTVTFDMAMYYVRQIADKYNASVNTFDAKDDKGSQLMVSFPVSSLS